MKSEAWIETESGEEASQLMSTCGELQAEWQSKGPGSNCNVYVQGTAPQASVDAKSKWLEAGRQACDWQGPQRTGRPAVKFTVRLLFYEQKEPQLFK